MADGIKGDVVQTEICMDEDRIVNGVHCIGTSSERFVDPRKQPGIVGDLRKMWKIFGPWPVRSYRKPSRQLDTRNASVLLCEYLPQVTAERMGKNRVGV
jgi:hypothetical protein